MALYKETELTLKPSSSAWVNADLSMLKSIRASSLVRGITTSLSLSFMVQLTPSTAAIGMPHLFISEKEMLLFMAMSSSNV